MTPLGLSIILNKGTSGKMDIEGFQNYDRPFELWIILCSIKSSSFLDDIMLHLLYCSFERNKYLL